MLLTSPLPWFFAYVLGVLAIVELWRGAVAREAGEEAARREPATEDGRTPDPITAKGQPCS